MSRTAALALVLWISLLAAAPLVVGAERYGFSPLYPLAVRSAPGEGGVVTVLPAHSLYFIVLEEPELPGGWVRIQSLPAVDPSYRGWVSGASVERFDSVRAARLRYFETHPLLAEFAGAAAALQGGYWDLREQGAAAEAAVWLRLGFDLTDWYVVRGRRFDSELRDVCDVLAADERRIILTVFAPLATTPPERIDIEILEANRIRVSLAGGPALVYSRSRR